MKLSRLYSNQDDKFQPIEFRDGLNVLYANITRPKEEDKDSHNLGKTTLLHLIDFMLLKQLRTPHFLHDHAQLFRTFEFYMEVELNYGSYVTIKRSVKNSSKISLKLHTDGKRNFADFQLISWDYDQLPLKSAIEVFNGILRLEVLGEYSYRVGLAYVLRTQKDFIDIFDVSKFWHGRDAEWKPLIALLLGFDHEIIKRKYAVETNIKELKSFRNQYEKQSGMALEQLDRVKQTIELGQNELAKIREQVDRFNYYAQDQKISTELVDEVERKIAEGNNRLYVVSYQMSNIDQSYQGVPRFNTEKVERLFREAQIQFPGQLRKSYNDLLEFNRRMSQERNKWLRKRRQELAEERSLLETDLQSLNIRREELLAVLQKEEWFEKYKAIREDLSKREQEVTRLEAERDQINIIDKNVRETNALTLERGELVGRIRDNISETNPTLQAFRSRFYSIIRDVLEHPAILSCLVNEKDNVEFAVSMLDAGLLVDNQLFEQITSESEGTSYRKILCAAFDIALLEIYSGKYFYRFLYHDGVLEGLDNRKKQRFLKIVQEFCDLYGLQYIMTVLDSDLPRNVESDAKTAFSPNAIIREFHENGSAGRLFNIPVF